MELAMLMLMLVEQVDPSEALPLLLFNCELLSWDAVELEEGRALSDRDWREVNRGEPTEVEVEVEVEAASPPFPVTEELDSILSYSKKLWLSESN